MKKAIISLLLMSSIFMLSGCGNKEAQIPTSEGEITAQTEYYTERTVTAPNGVKTITKRFNNGHIETVIEEGNKVTRINKSPDGNVHKMIEETTKDSKGNKLVKRIFNDGSLEKEVHEGNIITRTHKNTDGRIDKSVEENRPDGTRIMTHTDPEGRIHRFTEKDLGNGKRHNIIENQLNDGKFERIEEDHEDLGNGKHKMIQKYEDGRIQEMLMTHTQNEDKNETTVIFPDGRVEKTTEQFFHQNNGQTKVVTTHPDGTKSERMFSNGNVMENGIPQKN